MERLDLPEPAAGLWRCTRDWLRSAFADVEKVTGYSIGGGTILAARWNHRISFDVDLQVDEDADLGVLVQPRHDDLQRAVAALGATATYDSEMKLYAIKFGEEQQVQVWAHTPALSRGQAAAVVDGCPETVLSTAQILRGKLRRAHHKLARDVYDVREAHLRDRPSLEVAVNTMPHDRVDRLALDWIIGHGRIARNARERLGGVPGEQDQEFLDLAREGAEAMIDARYERFRLRVEQGAIVAEAITEGGDQRRMVIAPKDAEEDLVALGITGHLRRKGPGADALQRYALELSRTGKGNILVYQEQDDTPTHWRLASKSLNLAVITPAPPGPATTGRRQLGPRRPRLAAVKAGHSAAGSETWS